MPTLPYPAALPDPNPWNPDKTETGRDGDDFLHRRWWRIRVTATSVPTGACATTGGGGGYL